MNHKVSIAGMKHAANARSYAIGVRKSNGFYVRKVVWGWTLAKVERRQGELIRRAIIMVETFHAVAPTVRDASVHPPTEQSTS